MEFALRAISVEVAKLSKFVAYCAKLKVTRPQVGNRYTLLLSLRVQVAVEELVGHVQISCVTYIHPPTH